MILQQKSCFLHSQHVGVTLKSNIRVWIVQLAKILPIKEIDMLVAHKRQSAFW